MDPSEKPNGTRKRARSAPGPHYRECLRNHAASLGAHALDGCGEFFPSAPPSSPLTCSACGCHRNFHRKVASRDPPGGEAEDSEDEAGSHVLLTLKTGAAGAAGEASAGPAAAAGPARGKRFRSRFSREQKEGMMELAERLGWRLQRQEEGLVEQGCRAIGVERGVFKVWMHNNKHAVFEMKRRSSGADAHDQGRRRLLQENNNNDDNGGGREANGDHKGSSSSSPSSHPSSLVGN